MYSTHFCTLEAHADDTKSGKVHGLCQKLFERYAIRSIYCTESRRIFKAYTIMFSTKTLKLKKNGNI